MHIRIVSGVNQQSLICFQCSLIFEMYFHVWPKFTCNQSLTLMTIYYTGLTMGFRRDFQHLANINQISEQATLY